MSSISLGCGATRSHGTLASRPVDCGAGSPDGSRRGDGGVGLGLGRRRMIQRGHRAQMLGRVRYLVQHKRRYVTRTASIFGAPRSAVPVALGRCSWQSWRRGPKAAKHSFVRSPYLTQDTRLDSQKEGANRAGAVHWEPLTCLHYWWTTSSTSIKLVRLGATAWKTAQKSGRKLPR